MMLSGVSFLPNSTRYERRESDGGHVELRAAAHADHDRGEQVAGVARVLDRRPEPDDGECTDEAEGPSDIASDDHHDHCGGHGHHEQRVDVGLGVARAAVSRPIDLGQDVGQDGRDRHGQEDVGEAEQIRFLIA
jgi:hypothetical protein